DSYIQKSLTVFGNYLHQYGVCVCVCVCVWVCVCVFWVCVCVCVVSVCVLLWCCTVTCKFNDINSVFGLVILTLVSTVYSWDPPEEKKDASLLSLLLYSHSATALSCVRGLISVLMQQN